MPTTVQRYHSSSATIGPRSRLRQPTVSASLSHGRFTSRSPVQHLLLRHVSSNGQDEDDGWIPPDHSPLRNPVNHGSSRSADTMKGLSNQHGLSSDIKMGMTSDMSEIDEDEIEVIDLEATYNNPSNQQYLKQLELEEGDTSMNDLFEIESSGENDLDEVLRELRDDGDEERLQQFVKQFGLQDKLAKIEQTDKARTNDDDYDWDFEQSLQDLSEDELIDELIENSTSLSQLEVEILTQEMDNNGLDVEDDKALSENTAYLEFRKMVLEDFNARRQSKEESSENKEANPPMAFDQSEFPQDWKDYDSKAAFSRDFLEEDDSWIPPVKDFVPSNSKLAESKSAGDKMSPKSSNGTDDFDDTIDWLQARRSRLEGGQKMPSHMVTPGQAETFRHENSHIPIIPHTLFTTSELSASLTAQGGSDIYIINTADYYNLYGVNIDCDHMMIVTGRNPSHVRVMAESVVRNLKDRKLHEKGVVGAIKGAEGGKDIFSNKPSRNRASRNGQAIPAKVDDDWMVVDCGNIHVHILESVTRKCLNIEGLWDLSNPKSEGSKLRRIRCDNEDEVDTYVAENPIPDEYASRLQLESSNYVTLGAGGRVHKLTTESFKRKSYSSKWSGKKQRGRRR